MNTYQCDCAGTDSPGILRFVGTNDRKQAVSFEERASGLIATGLVVSHKHCRFDTCIYEITYLKKKEQPRTWLCTNPSGDFSLPKSSKGSAHRISHIRP